MTSSAVTSSLTGTLPSTQFINPASDILDTLHSATDVTTPAGSLPYLAPFLPGQAIPLDEGERGAGSSSSSGPSAAISDPFIATSDLKFSGATEDSFDHFQYLNRGTYGSVYCARYKPTRKMVAIKKINLDKISMRPNGRINLQREIELSTETTLAQIPNTVRFYTSFYSKDQKELWLVMEFIPGEELFSYTKRHLLHLVPEEREREARDIVLPIILALTKLQEREIFFRDLKTENIMVELDHGKVKRAILIDYGSSKRMGTLQRTSSDVGTLEYLTPEQLNRKSYSYSIYSWQIGVLLFELLTGYPPFYRAYDKGDPDDPELTAMVKDICDPDLLPPLLSELSSDFSDEIQDLLDRLLVKDPEQRLSLELIIKHSFFISHNRWKSCCSVM